MSRPARDTSAMQEIQPHQTTVATPMQEKTDKDLDDGLTIMVNTVDKEAAQPNAKGYAHCKERRAHTTVT